jgi:hypothetical protein
MFDVASLPGRESTAPAAALIVRAMSTTISLSRPLLPLALRLDAVVTGANGAAYLAAASLLDSPLGLSAPLLRGVGAFLLAFAAFVWFVSLRPSAPLVVAVIGANVVWALDSVLAAALDWGTPSTAGAVWIVLQALVVAGFAAFQAYAARSDAA